MASKAMQARLAAKSEAAAGPVVDDAGDVSAGMGADESAPGEEVVETSTATEATETDAAAVEQATETPEQAESKARAKRLEVFEEKLKGAREKRASQRLIEKAKADRKAAEEERRAASEQKAKWERLGKEGTYKDVLTELGRDPRAEYEAMTKEAIEGATPEAIAQRQADALKREVDAKLTPLQQEVERLRAERADVAKQAHEHAIVSSFNREAADPAFKDLRIEYDDGALIEYARHFDKNPDLLRATAQLRNVQLTNPEKGFTMREILQVLAAEQAAHNVGVQARRAALSPAEAQAGKPTTVNGTAERRNAATAIGNDLASQRASAKAEVSSLSPRERMRQRASAEIRRGGG